MLVSALIAKYRQRADDRNVPQFLTDAEVVGELNEAMDEACIRARLLTDATTAEICFIDLTDDTVLEFTLDPRVIEVDAVRIDGIRDPLQRCTLEDFEQRSYTPTLGSPREYAVTGLPGAGLTLTLDRAPDTSKYTMLRMTVKRLQLTPLRVPDMTQDPPTDDDTPEIAVPLHQKLAWWPTHSTAASRDTDQSDPQRAEKALAYFEAAFGVRPDANVQRKRLRHRAPVCIPDGPPPGNNLPIRRRYRPTVTP